MKTKFCKTTVISNLKIIITCNIKNKIITISEMHFVKSF